MFNNYLKIAARSLLRNKLYSIVTILGLSLGMGCCLLMLVHVQNELSFDRFNQNHERTYRLVAERTTAKGIANDATLPPPLAPSILRDVPQVTRAVRLFTMDNPVPLISNGERRFYENGLYFIDSGFDEVFSVSTISGDLKQALIRPNTVVITEEVARRYFGADDPLGKVLSLNGTLSLEVTAVIKSLPANSSIRPELLVSFSTLRNWVGEAFVESWQNNTCQIFVLLEPHASSEEAANRLTGSLRAHLGESSTLRKIFFQPLDRLHLYSYRDYAIASSGDIQSVLLLAGIATLVLLVACVNYVNLTTSRLVMRAKEVGVRKLIGATRSQLVRQFLVEAFMTIAIALAVGLVAVEITLPTLQAALGASFATSMLGTWPSWMLPIGAVTAIGMLSALYPASILSSLKPLESARGFAHSGSRRALLRKGMIVFQFALTVMLIIGTWTVYNQVEFVQRASLGLNKDDVVIVPIRDQNLRKNPEALKASLMQIASVQHVGAAALLPGGPVGRARYRAGDKSAEGSMSMLWVDPDFIGTLGLTMNAGRPFTAQIATDAAEAFIINEKAAAQLGWADPMKAVGEPFELVGGKKGTIIGVVKDFNFFSLHRGIEPLVMHIWPWMNYMLIRFDQGRRTEILDNIGEVYRKFDPVNPFTWTLLRDNFDRSYDQDKRLEGTFAGFSLLAILIACSGLVSLAAFTAERRTKEIGVRKVLGASTSGIVALLTREYLILVLLANLLAWPVAYVVMNRWLQDFAYRVDIGVATFLVAGLVSALIAMLTVSYHALRAAGANPVEALRYE
ncbi:MAG TPA: ABC transporter permease [Bacteroidota bacterium]|nr:ABC transporter permease [Bacteroidota bacterium]